MPNREQIISRRSGVETRTTPAGAVLVDMNTGQCFRLNRVGADVWSLLETPRSVAELCSLLGERYRRSPADAERDITSMLAQLLGARLVDQASVATPPSP